MTTLAPERVGTPARRAALPPARVIADIALLAQRNLIKSVRMPMYIVFSTIQPFMQLVLFVFVFGSIADIGPGMSYRNYVVPAVLVQTMTFAGMGSGVGIARDLDTGMIDRFRSLPIARSAFLVGRTSSDSLRLGVQATLLVVAAMLMGFRFGNGALPAFGMFVIVVMFGLALTTFSAWMGLTVRDPETVQAAMFIPVIPLVFTSSAFAPISRLPGWMQPFAEWSPVTAAIDSARGLALGDEVLYQVNQVHLHTALWHFLLWWVVIVVVFTALAVRRYRLGS
ncbi:MAG: ABC transporter permease [Actinobacteria bacterium]|nr:ABC transporter permease [Actinomycetota bacterium]